MKKNLLAGVLLACQKVTANFLLNPVRKYLIVAFLMVSFIRVSGHANYALVNSNSAFESGQNYLIASRNNASSNFSISNQAIDTRITTEEIVGSREVSIKQKATKNYSLDNAMNTVNTDVIVYANGDYRTKSNVGAITYTSNSAIPDQWQIYNNGIWDPSNSPILSTSSNIYISIGTTVTTATTFNNSPKLFVLNGGNFISKNNSSFNTVYVYEGGRFEFSNHTINISTLLEVEDNATFVYNYAANPGSGLTESLWKGIEKFHPKSTFEILNHDPASNVYFLPPATSFTPYTENGITAYFGKLVVNSTNKEVRLATNNLSSSTIYLTAGDLSFAPSVNQQLFYGSGNWIIGGDFILKKNAAVSTIHSLGILGGILNNAVAVVDVKGNYKSDSNNILRIMNDTAGNNWNATLIVRGDCLVSNGAIDVSYSDNSSVTFNIGGDLNLTNTAVFNLAHTSSGKATVNLKGKLVVANTARLYSDSLSPTASFNFTGIAIQTLDINTTNTSNSIFNVNSGSSVRLINQDFILGTKSSFTIKTGGTLDFGFDSSNDALNIVNNGILTEFKNEMGSKLIITSPAGITTSGTTGNVQVTSTRHFNENATYHYKGTTNQVSGNGLPKDASDKKVIVELSDDSYTFQPTGLKKINENGFLEIRKGIVLDNTTGGFEDGDSFGNLIMSGGIYRLFKTGINPKLSGNYIFSDGVIEFSNANLSNQTIRSQSYLNVEVTGKPVGKAKGNITILDGGTFKVKHGGEFTINSKSIVGSSGTQILTVEDGGVFKTGDEHGFSGTAQTSIQPSIEYIVLEPHSTVEYSRTGDQTITNKTTYTANPDYGNLVISGSGIKTAIGETIVKEMTTLLANEVTLKVASTADYDYDNPTVIPAQPNVFYAKKGIHNSNGASGTFLLENNAMLMQDADANNSNASIKQMRTSKMKRLDYIYWGTSVSAQTLKSFSPNTVAARFYKYHEIDDSFSIIPNAENMVGGSAYVIRSPNDFGVSPQPFIGTFIGKPNNGDVDVVVTKIGLGKNLVGNPYPSNIDLDDLTAANPLTSNGVYYFWTNNYKFVDNGSTPNGEYGNYENNNYATYNLTGGVASSNGGAIPSGIIKPGQGFLFEAVSGGSLNFTNAHRTKQNTDSRGKNSVFIANKSAAGKEIVKTETYRLKLTSPIGNFNTLLLAYIEGATNTYESNYDAKFPVASSDQFYSISDDQNLIIQGRQYPFFPTDVVALGMKTFKAGEYNIAVSDVEGVFASGQKIYLKDKQSGIITNLTQGSYSFTATEGVSNGRFEIRYNPETTLASDNLTKNQVTVYETSNYFVVNSPTKRINKIEVFDSSGRIVETIVGNSNEIKISNALWSKGLYVFKIIQNGVTLTRKVIK